MHYIHVNLGQAQKYNLYVSNNMHKIYVVETWTGISIIRQLKIETKKNEA